MTSACRLVTSKNKEWKVTMIPTSNILQGTLCWLLFVCCLQENVVSCLHVFYFFCFLQRVLIIVYRECLLFTGEANQSAGAALASIQAEVGQSGGGGAQGGREASWVRHSRREENETRGNRGWVGVILYALEWVCPWMHLSGCGLGCVWVGVALDEL